MEVFRLEKSAHQPKVVLDPESGNILFEGNLVAQNIRNFFDPIFEWCHQYFKAGAESANVEVRMPHYNTAASKMIVQMFCLLKDYEEGGAKINVDWFYVDEDEDMVELAHETEEVSGLKFNFHSM